MEHLNDRFRKLANGLKRAVMTKTDWKAYAKEEKERQKSADKSDERRPRTFVLDFKGDLKASAVPSLREEVSAVIDVAEEGR